MRILFDNGTPKPIARNLIGHEVTYRRISGALFVNVTPVRNPRHAHDLGGIIDDINQAPVTDPNSPIIPIPF